ncbi:MAG TPA: hypothetical protein PLL30_01765 [Candidatus Krumholzibacteria bacterium]|nr:hypothetical protein [Candidatus Krumholzibacteria bacterium]HPD70492.1 hypothetical protein [Candidatus Krumholzibacteria bacterium]HRY39808.1 hypothetical protein [Candidatus Krumholzibacteria bacterium]
MKRTWIVAAVLAAAFAPAGPASGGEPTFAWSLVHDGGAGLLDDGTAVVADAAGDVLVGGMQTRPGGHADLLVRKYDRVDGSLAWSYTYVDTAGNDLTLADLVLDRRQDVLVAGYRTLCGS